VVHPAERSVGGDDDHVQVVDLGELLRLGVGGAGHARELGVHAEVVLDGDGGQRLVLLLDLDLFLRLHRLVQPVAPPPPRHQAAGELVHDDDLASFTSNHVPLVEGVGAQPCWTWWTRSMLRDRRGSSLPGASPRQDARLGQRDRLGLLVHDVVAGRGRLDLVQLPDVMVAPASTEE